MTGYGAATAFTDHRHYENSHELLGDEEAGDAGQQLVGRWGKASFPSVLTILVSWTFVETNEDEFLNTTIQ